MHKALDQVGAFAGPLLVAGVIALTGALWPGLAMLAVPGVCRMLLLLVRRAGPAGRRSTTTVPLEVRRRRPP